MVMARVFLVSFLQPMVRRLAANSRSTASSIPTSIDHPLQRWMAGALQLLGDARRSNAIISFILNYMMQVVKN